MQEIITMKEKVYLDSTIPSYYFDKRESLTTFIEITRKWWSEMSDNYDLLISDAVLQELSEGSYPNKEEIIKFVSNIPLLPTVDNIELIVEFYIENYVMPKSFVGDAAHHLANANKRRHIRIMNGRLGLSTPEIITPLELFKEEDKND